MVLVSTKSGFSFWFQFCSREGVGVFLPPLNNLQGIPDMVRTPLFFAVWPVANTHEFTERSFCKSRA